MTTFRTENKMIYTFSAMLMRLEILTPHQAAAMDLDIMLMEFV